MPDFPELPILPPSKPFPELPIVTPDPPRATLREKYGGLYYLGVGGLVFATFLVLTFVVGVWITRELWLGVLVLHDTTKPEAERIQAAWTVAHHEATNDRQRIDIALRKELPDLARYIVAEAMTSESIQADPKAYAVMVANSEGWPPWLRLALIQPMAYGVGEGYRIAWEPLDKLRANPDPSTSLWATYTRAVMGPGDAPARDVLVQAAQKDGPARDLARLLEAAAASEGDARVARLDEATRWLRTHQPEVAPLWKGWEVVEGKLARAPSREGGETSRP
jgi:hypothetical protein